MRKTVSIYTLVCAFFLSLALAFSLSGIFSSAEEQSSEITLNVVSTSTCSSEVAAVTIGGINFYRVSSAQQSDGLEHAIYRVGVEKTDITSITGQGTAGDPSSYTGAVEFYAYLDADTAPAGIDFRIDHDTEDDYAQQGFRGRASWTISLEPNEIIKITAPFKAASFGGAWSTSEDLVKAVGGFCLDMVGVEGDLHVSAVRVVESDMNVVAYETTGMALEVTSTSTCSNGTADEVTLNGMRFYKVSSAMHGSEMTAAFRVGLARTDITSVTGKGTAGDPSSYTGAIEFYAYLAADKEPNSIDFRIDHNTEDQYAQDGYRPRAFWTVGLENGILTKIVAPFCAASFGGLSDWGTSENLFSEVGGFCFEPYGINGDLYISDIFVVKNDAAAVSYIKEKTLTVQDSGSSSVPAPATMGEISMNMVSSSSENKAIYRVDAVDVIDASEIVGNGTIGIPFSYMGALEFYVYLDADSSPVNTELVIFHDMADDNALAGYRGKAMWSLTLESGKMWKVSAPFAACTFGGLWNDSKELFERIGGFMLSCSDVIGDMYVSAIKIVPFAGSEVVTQEIQISSEPQISVDQIAAEAYVGETLNVKPAISVPSGLTLQSVSFAVSGAVSEQVAVESDDDYEYTFTESGEYVFTYAVTVSGTPYTAYKTVTVHQQKEIQFAFSKNDTTTMCSSAVTEITLAGIPMYMIQNTVGHATFGAEIFADGDPVDITSITGDSRRGAIEIYIYYSGNPPTSTEFRLDCDSEDSNSWQRYHQSFNPRINVGKLMKYVFPLSLGGFSQGFETKDGSDAHTALYNQLAGFMVQLVNAQGYLLVSAPRVITSSATAIATEEIKITEPVILTGGILGKVVADEAVNMAPFIIEPTVGENYILSFTAGGPASIDEFVPESDEEWYITFTQSGSYSVTYKLSDGTHTFTEDISIEVIESESRDITKDTGFYDGRSSNYEGERYFGGKTYRYVTRADKADLRYAWFRAENADNNTKPAFSITDMDLEALALEFYMYADYTGSISNAEVHLGNCTNEMYYDAGWTYKYWFVNDIPDSKLVKVTLRLSDAGVKQADAQMIYDSINCLTVYIVSDGGVSSDFMLVSDARVYATNKLTGIELADEDFIPDLTAPEVSASFTGGDYKDAYNLVPTVEKLGYSGGLDVQITVGYGDNVLNTYYFSGTAGSDLNAKMAEELSAFRFPTGRTYTVKVTAADAYGNSICEAFDILITGEYIDDVDPVIDYSDFKTAIKRGDEVDLTAVSVTDNADAGSDISIVYDVKLNGNSVAVTDGTFIAGSVGTYIITITATDKTGNSATETFEIIAAKKTETPPTIEVPESFATEYSVKGQVNLSSITAKAEDGTAVAVNFFVKAPDQTAVTVTNGKFTFGAAGDYTVTITASDADGNTATRNLTIKATGSSGAAAKGGCKSSLTVNCFAAGTAVLFAAYTLLQKKRKG